MDIGSEGLSQVNLIIPQGTSLSFEVNHKDDSGDPVDHTASTCKMAFKAKDGTVYDLSDCCTGTATGISVSIPGGKTVDIPVGKLNWDVIVSTTDGESLRMAYGTVKMIDTYALDVD